jgi:hypothetical protein
LRRASARTAWPPVSDRGRPLEPHGGERVAKRRRLRLDWDTYRRLLRFGAWSHTSRTP